MVAVTCIFGIALAQEQENLRGYAGRPPPYAPSASSDDRRYRYGGKNGYAGRAEEKTGPLLKHEEQRH